MFKELNQARRKLYLIIFVSVEPSILYTASKNTDQTHQGTSKLDRKFNFFSCNRTREQLILEQCWELYWTLRKM